MLFQRIAPALILLAIASSILAAEAQRVFDDLFAAKIRAVTQTSDRADDVALAKEMLDLAKTGGNEEAFLVLLCDGAYDLGMRDREGFAVAVEAMTLLAARSEAHRAAATAKKIDALNRAYITARADDRAAAGEALITALLAVADDLAARDQYKDAAAEYRRATIVAAGIDSPRADAVRAKVEWAVNRGRIHRLVDQYRTKLLEDATDHATAEALVMLYVVELDDPASAKPYLRLVKDEALKKHVPLAAEPVGKLDESACESLGDWYASLAAASRDAEARARLYQRAAACYARFLELHPADDLARTRVALQLKEVEGKSAFSKPDTSAPEPSAPAAMPDHVSAMYRYAGEFERRGVVVLNKDGTTLMLPHGGKGSWRTTDGGMAVNFGSITLTLAHLDNDVYTSSGDKSLIPHATMPRVDEKLVGRYETRRFVNPSTIELFPDGKFTRSPMNDRGTWMTDGQYLWIWFGPQLSFEFVRQRDGTYKELREGRIMIPPR